MRQHGLRRTVFHYGFSVIRRFAPFEVLCLFTADGEPTGNGQVPGYVTREVTLEEFEIGTTTLRGNHDHSSVFQRGDRCFANAVGEKIVGYTLYARRSSRILKDLELHFPEGFEYGYASYTDPDHRGKGLALARSDTRKWADRRSGLELR